MSKAEIEAHRDKHSPSWNKKDGPWNKHPDAMWLKTVLKRPIMQGLVPIASDYRDFAGRDETEEVAAPAPAAGEITADEEWELFRYDVIGRLSKATTLTEVSDVVEALNSEYIGEKQAEYIFKHAEATRNSIRDRRGERSK